MLTTMQTIFTQTRRANFRYEVDPEPYLPGIIGYHPRREAVIRWLVKRLGMDIVMRPTSRHGRMCHDVDFYLDSFLCGKICVSRHSPDNRRIFPRGWYISEQRLLDLRQAMCSHHYGCIVYAFGNGAVYFINLTTALDPETHTVGDMEPLGGGRRSSGIYMRPEAFLYLGNLNEA